MQQRHLLIITAAAIGLFMVTTTAIAATRVSWGALKTGYRENSPSDTTSTAPTNIPPANTNVPPPPAK